MSILIKLENRVKIGSKLILKYLLYLITCLFPASIVAGVMNTENPLIYILLLFGFDLCLVVALIKLKKQNKNFYWFLLAPVLPTVVFQLMAYEAQDANK
jgi:uncharacterized membrane protein (GlpM family)